MAGEPSYYLEPRQAQTFKQTQMLMMQPQMQQAIALLQAPIMDVSILAQQEMDRNPILEQIEEEEDENINTLDKIPEDAPEDQEVVIDHDDFSILKQLDEEYRDFFDQNSVVGNRSAEADKLRDFVLNSVSNQETLFSHLMAQAQDTFDTEESMQIAELVAGSLDERGFLETPLQEIATLGHVDVDKVKVVVEQFKSFDPAGVCAENTQESLLIQLKSLGKENSLSYRIVKKYYDELLHNRIDQIHKGLKQPMDEIESCIRNEISRLDLRPGLWFYHQDLSYIVPDAKILEEDGKLKVVVNDDSYPSLRLNRKYLRMLDQEKLDKKTREFIHEKLLSAKWLLKNIYQRNSTLERVLECVVDHQTEYLRDPEGRLVPMLMLDIAEKLELHESTIARAVSNKYVDAPRGIILLRSMFSHAYTTEDGEDISANTIRTEMMRLIKAEDDHAPLSDAKIVDQLNEQGIQCARRTIAKYRRELNIGNAHQRKHFA